MATVHPAVIWLIIAAIVGVALLIATFVANRSQKKKKKGELFVILPSLFFPRRLKCTVHFMLRQLKRRKLDSCNDKGAEERNEQFFQKFSFSENWKREQHYKQPEFQTMSKGG